MSFRPEARQTGRSGEISHVRDLSARLCLARDDITKNQGQCPDFLL